MSTFDDNFPAKGNPKMSDRVFGFDSEGQKNAGMVNQALYDLFKGNLEGEFPTRDSILPAFDLDNIRVMTSTAPDNKIIKSNVLDPRTGEYVTYKEVDFTPETVDGVVYINHDGKVFQKVIIGSVYVTEFGAKGDGITDDTDAINRAILFGVKNNKKVVIPYSENPYMIDPLNSPEHYERGIIIRSNLVLEFEKGARLKAFPQNQERYCMMSIKDVSDVTIIDPWLIGDKDEHIGTTGQWGHCIGIIRSKNIYIHNPRCDKAWGDGITFAGGNDPSLANNNINILGKSQFYNCRRQGISVLEAKNCYVQNAYGEDISGHNPQAVIDFEPNLDTEVIYNFVVGTVTAVRCRYSVLFASQSSKMNITVNNVFNIDSTYTGALHFDGLGIYVKEHDDSQINIGTYYSNKCTTAPVKIQNWYKKMHSSIDIGKIIIDEWNPVDNTEVTVLRFGYGAIIEAYAIGNIRVGDFEVNRKTLPSGARFAPYGFYGLTTPLPENIIEDIYVSFKAIDGVAVANGIASIPINPRTVVSIERKDRLDYIIKRTGTSHEMVNNHTVFTTNDTVTLELTRRGFKSCIVNNSSDSGEQCTYTLSIAPISGITTVVGDGITISGNSFTINYGAVVKVERTSNTQATVTLLFQGYETPESIIDRLKNGLLVAPNNNIYIAKDNSLTGTDSAGRFRDPNGGIFKSTSSASTGSIRIGIPVSFTEKMTVIKGTVYNFFNNTSFSFNVSFFSAQTTANRSTANIIGGSVEHPIRIYRDGNRDYIYIGNSDYSWRFVYVSIDEVHHAHLPLNINALDGWEISIQTAFSGTLVSEHIKTFPFSAQSEASANTASVASGATPTKAEFDALLTELRDLKTKMRTAGLLAT